MVVNLGGDVGGDVCCVVGVRMVVRATTNSSPPMRATRSSALTASPQPSGHCGQYGVTGGVAVFVVDRLEIVEVHEEHRDGLAGAGLWLSSSWTPSRKVRRFMRLVSGSGWP